MKHLHNDLVEIVGLNDGLQASRISRNDDSDPGN